MANSFVQYTGNGATVLYTVPFPFLSRSHVTASLGGVPSSAFSWISDSQIQFSVAPGNGVVIEIRRSTSPNAILVDFSDGARIKESDLDRSQLQQFYLAQEAVDAADTSIRLVSDGTWDATSRRIKNVNVPVNGSDAATKDYTDAVATGALLSPLSVANGGTGGSTTAAARVGLGMADVGKTNVVYNPGMAYLRNPTANSHNPTAGVPTYLLQRWYTMQVGGSPGDVTTDQQVTGGPETSYSNFARITRNVGSTLSFTRFGQIFPTSASKLLAGKSLTIRFWARAGAAYSVTGSKLKVFLTTSTGPNQSAVACEDGTWTSIANTLDSDVTLATGWQQFSLTTTGIPSGTNQISLRFQASWTGTALANDHFDITGVQMAASGSLDVPINELPTELDELRCLAFYQTIGDGGAANAAVGSGKMNDTDTGSILINYALKRIPPTITLSSVSHFYLNTQTTNDTVTAFSVVLGTLQRDRAFINVDIGASRTAGDGCALYGLNTSARVFIDAEF